VGVKGSHISGGQKQRVAIARTILRNPNVLLLDEATSALDSANEKKVQESLDKIMANKTTISIAHRIDTIKNSDEIFVFEKGVIVEKGKYESLISQNGHFYKL
jgi:ATP-binding cassette subfamily B (MDR/TAP) protein 1